MKKLFRIIYEVQSLLTSSGEEKINNYTLGQLVQDGKIYYLEDEKDVIMNALVDLINENKCYRRDKIITKGNNIYLLENKYPERCNEIKITKMKIHLEEVLLGDAL